MHLFLTEPVRSVSPCRIKRKHSLIRFAMRVSLFYCSLLLGTVPLLMGHTGKGQELHEMTVTLEVQHENLTSVLKKIEQKTGLSFVMPLDEVETYNNISFRKARRTIKETLDIALKDTSLGYRQVKPKTVLIFVVKKADRDNIPDDPLSETRVLADLPAIVTLPVKGKVTDEKGEGLPGVSILLKGTQQGTISDAKGTYALEVPDENAVLVFSFVGFESKEVVVGNTNVLDVVLKVDEKSLEEVVVVGYGTQKKVNLTGSVSTIDAADLTAVPMPSLAQSMMGRAAGVFIKNGNGQPGQNKTTFNIRGFGTPLMIIDGLPASQNDFNHIDPNEIESFSILKDAASAAVYGARAGNGVILITTKKGNTSAPEITYNANVGAQFFAVIPEFVSSADYARMENMARYNEGQAPIWTNDQIQKLSDGSDPLRYANTNWWDETLRQFAPLVQHNINVRGGTEGVRYFVSGGYQSQRGMERSNDTKSDRYNLRSNIDVSVTKKLNVNLNLSLIYQDYIGSVFQLERGSVAGIMTRIYRARPFFPAHYPDPTKLPAVGGADDAPTVYTEIDNVGYKKWNKLTGDAKMTFSYQLPFGIQARANYRFYRLTDQYKEKRKKTPTYNYNPDSDEYTLVRYIFDPSQLYEKRSVANNLDQQYFLTWNKTFNKHYFDALLVHEVLSNSEDWIEASRRRYDFDIDYLFAGPDLDKDNNGSAGQGGRKGWVTRLNYDYEGKYLVELNGRLDASPRFPREKRWGFFPSASVGWRISEEDFLKNSAPFLNNLKVRASYGKLGYDNVGNFQYLQTYSVASTHIFDGVSNTVEKGIRADALANTTITWEKMTTSNVGFDFGLWNNLLEGSMDYFYRRRTDVLGARLQSLPNVVGANMPQVNYAEYDNRGWELMLNHQHRVGDITYSLGGNVSWNREKALLVDQNEFASQEARRTGNRIGEWTDVVWGRMTDGLFQTKEEIENWADQDGRNNATILPGDVKIIDYNGDGRITNEDNVIIGRGTFPKLTYGVNLSLSWKGFDLGMLWQGAGLYDFNLRNSPDLTLPLYAGNTPTTAMLKNSYVPQTDAEHQWLPANTDARWPRYRTDNYNRGHTSFAFNDFWLINGSYVRLKNLELGYTLPAALTQKWAIRKCKIYVSGSNLLTFSKLDFLDPEADTSPAYTFGDYYPPVGSYNVGLLLQF